MLGEKMPEYKIKCSITKRGNNGGKEHCTKEFTKEYHDDSEASECEYDNINCVHLSKTTVDTTTKIEITNTETGESFKPHPYRSPLPGGDN
ncbi:MAG: hypothetical protein V1802_03585 [Candidatus Aenigmatarchaeota archaeon]